VYLVNCSILFADVPMLGRAAAARSAGFDTVEFWWPFPRAVPADADVDAFVTSITDAGVHLAYLNLFAGDMAAGERGLLSWPGRAAELRYSVAFAVGIGKRLGVAGFNALYGNRIDGVDPRAQDELAVENLAAAATATTRISAELLLEPLSGLPRYPLLTTADVLDVLARADAVGITGVAMLADLYHLAVNGDDVDASITAHTDRFGHIQIADAPGRGAPGSGNLPLKRWIGAAFAAGYRGHISLEYLPTTPDPFAWLPAAQRSRH
jgi:hydroxypyruvate isomerase